jgi:hypothetical protein
VVEVPSAKRGGFGLFSRKPAAEEEEVVQEEVVVEEEEVKEEVEEEVAEAPAPKAKKAPFCKHLFALAFSGADTTRVLICPSTLMGVEQHSISHLLDFHRMCRGQVHGPGRGGGGGAGAGSAGAE